MGLTIKESKLKEVLKAISIPCPVDKHKSGPRGHPRGPPSSPTHSPLTVFDILFGLVEVNQAQHTAFLLTTQTNSMKLGKSERLRGKCLKFEVRSEATEWDRCLISKKFF